MKLPLAAYRVVEIGSLPAAAYAARLFADFGAEVIKVEPPDGDPDGGFPPLIDAGDGKSASGWFAYLNDGKKSVVADGPRLDELLAGADLRYDMGEPDPAPATGRFAPNLTLTTEDGVQCRLAELRRDARPLLVDLSGAVELAEVAGSWADRVARVAAYADGPSLLVRPDGYVAWSGTDPDGLRAALGHWFGVPAHARALPVS